MKKYQQLQSISELKEGDTIRGRMSGWAYTVHGTYGDRATAVRTVDVTNPSDWEVYRDAEDDDEKFTLEFTNEVTLTGPIKRCDSDLLFVCEVENSDALIIQSIVIPGTEADVCPAWYGHSSMRVKGRSIEMDEGMPVKVYLRLEATG